MSIKDEQLKIFLQEESREHSVPMEDIGYIILETTQATLTTTFLAACSKYKVVVYHCNEKHMPVGLTLPVYGHTEASLRTRAQIEATKPLKKQLWAQLIKAKISNQARLLHHYNELAASRKLFKYASVVKSGDPENLEARAASHYWKHLTSKRENFIRNYDGEDDLNIRLNYGYAILRGAVARALVGSGLLLILGVHHKNKYNPYSLADDVMEPYRPFIDRLVMSLPDSESPLNTTIKSALVSVLTMDVNINDSVSPMMEAIRKTASSAADCYLGVKRTLILPEINGV